MQNYRPLTNLLKRTLVVDSNRVLLRPFASIAPVSAKDKSRKPPPAVAVAGAGTTKSELSNRQKFNQIQPPIKLYEKLEKLGFGTLLKTKRFAGIHKQKAKRDQQRLQHTERVGPPPEPKYAVSKANNTFFEKGNRKCQLNAFVVSFTVIFCRSQNT